MIVLSQRPLGLKSLKAVAADDKSF